MSPSSFRYRVSHLRFCVVYCATLFVAGNAMNLERLSRWFRDGESLDASAFAAYLLAGMCLFVAIFVFVAHRWTIKPFAIVIAVAGGAAAYFVAKYGVAIDSSMVRNAVHTDATEVGQLLSWRMVPYAILLIAAPTLAVLAADITFEPRGRYLRGSLQLFAVAMIVALASLALESRAIFRAGNASNKYIVYTLVPVNVISASINAAAKSLTPYFATPQRDLEIDARMVARADLVVVLAVGESARRANFGLYGYTRRDTTPRLATVAGLHRLDAVATRASTLYALPKILEKDGIKLTTLTSKAGVPTACYVNYTLYDNCAAVGETRARDCRPGGKCYDEDVLPLLEADLASWTSGPKFVVLHFGGGSHGPRYADRHPPAFTRFRPTCDDADVANRCTSDQLWNSYDNTILYTDHVVAETIAALERSRVPYVLIYLSDHGESLGEDGRLFHGVPPGMSLPREQAEIPLLVKASVPMTVAPRAQYGQPDVFDSVLSLLSIESPGFDQRGSFLVAPTD
jgi:lipid A ethanolaminephosphotransferase